MEQLVKEIRLELDRYAQLSWSISINPKQLLLSKAWLGEILGKLGTQSPYLADDKRHTIEDIKPTAEKAGISMFDPQLNEIEKISYLRLHLKELKKRINDLTKDQAHYYEELNKNYKSALQDPDTLEDKLLVEELKKNPPVSVDIVDEVRNSYLYITDFIFELGFILQDIKERADARTTVSNS